MGPRRQSYRRRLLGFAPAAQAATSTASVVGAAEIDTTDPVTTFDVRVHAHGDGRSGEGVIRLTHHDDTRIAWAVARVDCVRRWGRVVVVTGVVGDVQDFADVRPGERVSVSVRDGRPDLVGVGCGSRCDRAGGHCRTAP